MRNLFSTMINTMTSLVVGDTHKNFFNSSWTFSHFVHASKCTLKSRWYFFHSLVMPFMIDASSRASMLHRISVRGGSLLCWPHFSSTSRTIFVAIALSFYNKTSINMRWLLLTGLELYSLRTLSWRIHRKMIQFFWEPRPYSCLKWTRMRYFRFQEGINKSKLDKKIYTNASSLVLKHFFKSVWTAAWVLRRYSSNKDFKPLLLPMTLPIASSIQSSVVMIFNKTSSLLGNSKNGAGEFGEAADTTY